MTFSRITRPQVSKSHTSLKSKTQNLVKSWLKAGSEVLTAQPSHPAPVLHWQGHLHCQDSHPAVRCQRDTDVHKGTSIELM